MFQTVKSFFAKIFTQAFKLPLKESQFHQNYACIHSWIFVMPCLILLIGLYLSVTAGKGFTLLEIVQMSLSWAFQQFSLSPIDTNILPKSVLNGLSAIRFECQRWLSWIVISWGMIRAYRTCVTYFTCQLLQTSDHILIQTGWLYIRTIEIPKNQIANFEIAQNMIGLFLNFGHIFVQTTGGTSLKIPYIMDPFMFKNISLHIEDAPYR